MIQSLVVPQVAKHGFDGGEASPITGSACFAVDGFLHPVGLAFFCCVGFASKERNLPDLGFLRCAQAFGALFAGQAVAQRAAVFDGEMTVVEAVRGFSDFSMLFHLLFWICSNDSLSTGR